VATNDAGGFVGRAKDLANRLNPVQKIGLGAIVVTVAVGALVLGRTTTSTSMSPLYTDLQSADASAVVDALAAKNVKYQLTDAGHTVLVPSSDVYNLRVSMAGAGLPNSSQGYSLLDKQGITTSDFRQHVDYQRALEGELDKTLEAMNGALPDESVFIDTPANPTASVLLVGKSTNGINSDTVDAVVHLVASGVKNLKPADVTVIDSTGAVLSAAGVDTGATGASGQNKATTAFEQRMSSSLTTLLSRTTGAGKVAVTVSADLNLDQVQSTSENYGPIGSDPGTYVISEQTATEIYSNGAAAAGATGVLGPDGAIVTATTLPVSTATTAPGTIRQLHVAVLVDDKAVSADQAKTIEGLVATAAGIDATRGDSLTVSRLPFDTSAQAQSALLSKADTTATKAAQKTQMIRTLAIAFVIVVALLLAYRSTRRARRLTTTPINIGEIGMARRVPAAAELEPTLNDAAAAAVSMDHHEDTMGEITMIADRRPEDVANVLRTWLAETTPRRS